MADVELDERITALEEGDGDTQNGRQIVYLYFNFYTLSAETINEVNNMLVIS